VVEDTHKAPPMDPIDQFLANRFSGGNMIEHIKSFEYPSKLHLCRALKLFHEIERCQVGGAKVLDVGVDSGVFFALLDSIGCDVTGVGNNPTALSRVRHRFPSNALIQLDLNNPLPFADGTFELIWAGDVFEHIPNTRVCVSESARVLKDGGRLMLTVPYHGRLKNILIALFAWERHFDPFFAHYKFFTHKMMDTVLRSCGMEIEKIRYVGRLWPVSTHIFVVAKKA